MASVRTSVPGSGYGNVFVDSLVWGGKAWDPASGPIKVYFGQSSDFAAASAVHGPSDYLWGWAAAWSWTSKEMQAFAYAMRIYSSVCNLTFAPARSTADADIVWWKTWINSTTLGAQETPSGGQIWGYFNAGLEDYWSPMQPGGEGLNTIIHELGHGLGLAHPHDGGGEGDATIFPGVAGAFKVGAQGLNQGIWTVMSYNSGWNKEPATKSYGSQGGLGAFDIAALQALYGANTTTAQGDDTYRLPTQNRAGTGWSCIWDTGGTDTISAMRSKTAVVIDLHAATLVQGDPHAGGFVSYQTDVAGGFTIAKGVTIENAFGGAGRDRICGNDAANLLRGNADGDTLIGWGGDDTLQGGSGDDQLQGSAGDDVLIGDAGSDRLSGGAGHDTFVFNSRPKAASRDRIIDFSVGDDTIRLENTVFTKLMQEGRLADTAFWIGAKAHDPDDRIVYDARKGRLYYDSNGSGAGHAVVIAILPKHLALTADSFFIA